MYHCSQFISIYQSFFYCFYIHIDCIPLKKHKNTSVEAILSRRIKIFMNPFSDYLKWPHMTIETITGTAPQLYNITYILFESWLDIVHNIYAY